jgi:hypothetical protein
VGLLLGGILLFAAQCRPRYTTVGLPDGRKYDLISLSRNFQAFGNGDKREQILLNYYGIAVQDSARIAEADDVMTLAKHAADEFGDSLIVVQQTYPTFSRWVWWVRGYFVAYKRSASGIWVRQ